MLSLETVFAEHWSGEFEKQKLGFSFHPLKREKEDGFITRTDISKKKNGLVRVMGLKKQHLDLGSVCIFELFPNF